MRPDIKQLIDDVSELANIISGINGPAGNRDLIHSINAQVGEIVQPLVCTEIQAAGIMDREDVPAIYKPRPRSSLSHDERRLLERVWAVGRIVQQLMDSGRAGDFAEALRDKTQLLADGQPVPNDDQCGSPAGEHSLPDLVTLDQAAAVVQQSKKTLERYLANGKLPRPDIQGGGGKPSRWYWTTLLPCLKKHCRPDLPDRFPGSRII